MNLAPPKTKRTVWQLTVTVAVIALSWSHGNAAQGVSKTEKTDLFAWFLETWDDVRSEPKKTESPKSPKSPKSKEAIARKQLSKCFHCHNSQNKFGIPHIPFTHDAKLLEWMTQKHDYMGKAYLGRELMIKLLWDDAHMPKASIKWHERKVLKDFLVEFGKEKPKS